MSVENDLVSLLRQRGWICASTEDPAGVSAIAESETSVCFIAWSSREGLWQDSLRLGSAVSAWTLARGGPKVWEAILILLVPSLVGNEEMRREVERDLNYCRRVVLEVDEASQQASTDHWLELKLAFLFPLEVMAETQSPSPMHLLERKLALAGTPPGVVALMLDDFRTGVATSILRIEEVLEGEQ